ncbi:hypothetical protein RFI_30060 [Reticulomyxa filosa]|uniref:Uncharacterized protein n=1 Tax=Reticulomyxa filosa TaxID=46433 RepID=X6M151_RETFI|nr:hypothetical protein RFI_30060 [Reticulomyxa filosa]|eukprot:ETO07331.1 hypothetical protein RFI_30060 [Reticulomyxa filosa]
MYFHVDKIRVSVVEYHLQDLLKRFQFNAITGELLEQSFGYITKIVMPKTSHRISDLNTMIATMFVHAYIHLYMCICYIHLYWKWGSAWLYLSRVICIQLTLEQCDELVREKLKRLAGMSLESVVQQFNAKTIELGRSGQFAFWGRDILSDKYGQPWVLKYNRQPLLSLTGTPTVKRIMEDLLEEMVDIVVDIRTKRLANVPVEKHADIMSTKHWEPVTLHYYDKKLKTSFVLDATESKMGYQQQK